MRPLYNRYRALKQMLATPPSVIADFSCQFVEVIGWQINSHCCYCHLAVKTAIQLVVHEYNVLI